MDNLEQFLEENMFDGYISQPGGTPFQVMAWADEGEEHHNPVHGVWCMVSRFSIALCPHTKSMHMHTRP